MILSFDSMNREYKVTLSGALSHTVSLGSDVHGNITRLNNLLDFSDTLKYYEAELADLHIQLETAKGGMDRPFPQKREYSEKSARLKELNILLNMDEKGHELLDAEPDDGDVEPSRAAPERER